MSDYTVLLARSETLTDRLGLKHQNGKFAGRLENSPVSASSVDAAIERAIDITKSMDSGKLAPKGADHLTYEDVTALKDGYEVLFVFAGRPTMVR
jgi:hypothetical protein